MQVDGEMREEKLRILVWVDRSFTVKAEALKQ
jgi:hypothetical protein